jgi:hypothetical protein
MVSKVDCRALVASLQLCMINVLSVTNGRSAGFPRNSENTYSNTTLCSDIAVILMKVLLNIRFQA